MLCGISSLLAMENHLVMDLVEPLKESRPLKTRQEQIKQKCKTLKSDISKTVRDFF